MPKNNRNLLSGLSGIQKLLSFGIIGLLLILFSLMSALYIIQYKPSIAFYNVPALTQKSITDSVQSANNKQYKVITLDNTIPLSKQKKSFKKASYLFLTEDFDTINYLKTDKNVKTISTSFFTGYCSNFVEDTVARHGTAAELPLLYDFYQLDINFPAFEKTNLSTITYWNDLKKFLKEEENQFLSPFLFAGNDDVQLINLIGVITEAVNSSADLKNAQKELYEAFINNNLDLELSKLSQPESKEGLLYPAILELKNMISEGLLHTSTLNLSMEDFQFQLNNKMCAAAFLRLSDHRQISRSVIEDYTTIYCPEIQKADAGRDADRTFSAPKIAAVKLKNNRRADNVLVRLSNTNQTELCSYSGLAPVQRECQVPDHQADDVRYWLAASKGPVLPLAAALPSKEARTAAAIYFRNLLQQQ